MRKFTDLTGKKYNRLTVINLERKDEHFRAYWRCKCDCGNLVIVRGDCLHSGNTKACGCLNKELASKKLKTANTKHGDAGKRIYKIWKNMKERCYKQTNGNYKCYGGRGIIICEDWWNYPNFKAWAINNGYSEDLSIDRINVNGNYEPSNCRWSTTREQQLNKTDSIYIEFNGEKKHLKEWADVVNIKYHTLYQRYKKNKNAEFVLRPHRHGGKVI